MSEALIENKTLRIVLVAPRIAENVGNVARTAMALSAELHLVGPLGFFTDKKHLRRSSVGYWEDLQPRIHVDFEAFWGFAITDLSMKNSSFYWATKNGTQVYTEVPYPSNVTLIFGNEDEGVDQKFWDFKGLMSVVSCRIPMAKVRCLNLATSVGIMGYEVLRQWGAGKQAAN